MKALPGESMQIYDVINHLPLKRENHPLVLICMGVEIATMRPIILEYVADQTNIPEIININVENSGEFIYKSELESTEEKDVKNYFTKSRNEMKEAINSTFQLKDARYYIVGYYGFLSHTVSFLLENNIEKNQIYLDKHQKGIKEIFETI